jgi:hypothetical protein
MREHPAEGTLQALLDGELSLTRTILLRTHLVGCAACRARIESAKVATSLVGVLLRRSTPKVDSASAWSRLVVRSGGRAESRVSGPAGWMQGTALAIATAAIIATMVLGTPRAQPGADAFALVREAQAHPATELLRDACCSDHDGGDLNDDGLLTLSSVGERVTVVIVYEDVDHSGTFTHGDIVRYVSTVPHAASAPQPAH